MSGAMEMFFVRPVAGAGEQQREQIAEYAATLGGVVLMTTASGALVLGMPPAKKDALTAHGLIDFVGGVSFNDEGPGAAALRQRFAMNAARQLAARGQVWIEDANETPPLQPGRAPWAQWRPPADGQGSGHPLVRFPAADSRAGTTAARERSPQQGGQAT